MSRITAPVGEVTTPIDVGQIGQELLARLVEQPFGGELALALLQQRHQGADAGGLQRLDDDLVVRTAGIGGEPPGGDHLEPVLRLDSACGRTRSSRSPPSMRALSSFSAK